MGRVILEGANSKPLPSRNRCQPKPLPTKRTTEQKYEFMSGRLRECRFSLMEARFASRGAIVPSWSTGVLLRTAQPWTSARMSWQLPAAPHHGPVPNRCGDDLRGFNPGRPDDAGTVPNVSAPDAGS